MTFEPHGYQQHCISQILDSPNIALWLDMGLGKTVITLTALQTLIYERWEVSRALIIAPKKVAEGTWTDEALKWDHLQDLRISRVLGSAAQRATALDADADIYIINRENTPWLVEATRGAWKFDAVVLDESTSFKNPGAKRWRALRAVRPCISRMIELTGTPAPNTLLDLWAQIYLLDAGARLGRSFAQYRDRFFSPAARSGGIVYTYRPKPGAQGQIYSALSDICVSMSAEDYLTLPDLITQDIPVVLSPEALKKYQRMERDALIGVDGETITATSAAALTSKLLQFCNGAAYDDNHNVVELHSCKIAALLETLEQLGGEHAVVYYYFCHDKSRILAALKSYPGEVRVYENNADLRDWNNGEISVLLAQPASCGYGLNLQRGGHHVIWFGLTWSLEDYLQANKRLHRQGQDRPVIVHRLIVRDGMDESVIRALESKNGTQLALINAVRARLTLHDLTQ